MSKVKKESKVKDESFITVQGFMVTELKLKGNELLVYAIIYGFSQDGESKYNGGLQYLADWCNATKQGVMKALKSLIDKGLVHKEEVKFNGIKMCEYQVKRYATKFNGVVNKVEQGMQQSLMGCETKFNEGMQQSLTGCETKFNGGMQQSLPNNIEDNIIDNIKDNIEDNIIMLGAEIPTPSVIQLITNKNEPYDITQENLNTFAECYPAVDIMQELRKMKAWLESNPTKRKTKGGMMRFVNNWLAREQDRGASQNMISQQQNTPPPQSGNVFVDMLRKSEEEGVDPF